MKQKLLFTCPILVMKDISYNGEGAKVCVWMDGYLEDMYRSWRITMPAPDVTHTITQLNFLQKETP